MYSDEVNRKPRPRRTPCPAQASSCRWHGNRDDRVIFAVGNNAQSKWGRHCCRPHSHQRVDALFQMPNQQADQSSSSKRAWRPMSDASRGRSSNTCPKACIFGAPEGAFRVRPLHRRSRRHPATVSTNSTPPLGRNLARALSLHSRSRDNDPIRFSISNGRLRFDP